MKPVDFGPFRPNSRKYTDIPHDFAIIVDGTIYRCHLAVAASFSPLIRNASLCDPTCLQFTADISDENGDFKYVMSYMYGYGLQFTDDNLLFLFKCAQYFDCRALLESTSIIFNDLINPTNVFHQLNQNLPITHLTAQINYVATNFEKLKDNPEFMELPLYIYDGILRENNLSYDTEISLFKWIQSIIDYRGYDFIQLYAHLIFEDLDPSCLQAIHRIVLAEDVAGALWAALKKRLLCKVQTEEIEFKEEDDLSKTPFFKAPSHIKFAPISKPEENIRGRGKLIPFLPSRPLNGIFSYITAVPGKKNDRSSIGIVAFDSGGCKKHRYLPKLIEHNEFGARWNNFDGKTFKKEDQWICIRLLKHRIALSGYTFSTPATTIDSWQPKSWRIYGSDDGKRWQILEEVRNNDAMNKPNAIVTFSIKNPTRVFFTYFRIEQLENHIQKHSADRYQFCLSAIEFFGVVEEILPHK